MANAPLSGRDGERYRGDLGSRRSEIFLRAELDSQHQIDPAWKISLSEQTRRIGA
jgi:hypothetical protein